MSETEQVTNASGSVRTHITPWVVVTPDGWLKLCASEEEAALLCDGHPEWVMAEAFEEDARAFEVLQTAAVELAEG